MGRRKARRRFTHPLLRRLVQRHSGMPSIYPEVEPRLRGFLGRHVTPTTLEALGMVLHTTFGPSMSPLNPMWPLQDVLDRLDAFPSALELMRKAMQETMDETVKAVLAELAATAGQKQA